MADSVPCPRQGCDWKEKTDRGMKMHVAAYHGALKPGESEKPAATSLIVPLAWDDDEQQFDLVNLVTTADILIASSANTVQRLPRGGTGLRLALKGERIEWEVGAVEDHRG